MNNNDDLSALDFNILGAYLDGALPPSEMAEVEEMISKNDEISKFMSDIEELDAAISDNINSGEFLSEDQLLEIELPTIYSDSEPELLSGVNDSFWLNDSSILSDSVFGADNLSNDTFDSIGNDDYTSDNSQNSETDYDNF